MILKVIASSSKGNCYLLEASNETLILELGVQMERVKKGLQYDFTRVVGALVTHEHLDHARALFACLKAGIDVYATAGTLGEAQSHHRAHTIIPLNQFKVGGFRVLPFDVAHDAKEPVGFLIEHPEMGRLLFVTDTFYIKYNFRQLDHLVLECNHHTANLDKLLDRDGLHPKYHERLIQSHLNFASLKQFLAATDQTRFKTITLIHLSDVRSDEALYIKELSWLYKVPVVAASDGVSIAIDKYPF